jgi:hypothetical protein
VKLLIRSFEYLDLMEEGEEEEKDTKSKDPDEGKTP